jgi:histidinol-phosphate aminotransferase
MKNTELDILRDEINELDDRMLKILDKRSEIVTKIGKLKDHSKGIVDLAREHEVLQRLVKLSKGQYSKDSIIRIWRELFEASSKLQLPDESIITTKRSIEKILTYKGGKVGVNGINKIIKLSSNENPLGPSKKIKSSIKTENLNRYPDINGRSVRDLIAKIHNIKSEQIILGCGSDETLLFAALAFCQSGDEIIHSEYGFEMYSIIAKVMGAVSKLAKEINYKMTVSSICEQLTPSTKLIYIANPNNPTGSYLSKIEIRELMSLISKNIIVVIDGAYAEYVERDDFDSDFSLVKEYENIIMTRTLSKAYGLAGIRLGWCYSSPKVASILSRVKSPFNINSLAQELALIAIQDQDHIKTIIKENKINKEWFEGELKKLNIKTIQTYTNFSLIELTNEMAMLISQALEKKGILIRQLDSYNLPHCLRISIGNLGDMKKIIKIIESLL